MDLTFNGRKVIVEEGKSEGRPVFLIRLGHSFGENVGRLFSFGAPTESNISDLSALSQKLRAGTFKNLGHGVYDFNTEKGRIEIDRLSLEEGAETAGGKPSSINLKAIRLMVGAALPRTTTGSLADAVETAPRDPMVLAAGETPSPRATETTSTGPITSPSPSISPKK